MAPQKKKEIASAKNKNVDDDNEKETADWSNKREEIFIDILYEHVKKGELQASTFKAKTLAEIGDELFAQVGKRFALDQLTGKFNRLRIVHREFSDLLEHTGFGWDPVSNTVTASPDVWDNYLQKKPKMKKFRLKGLAHYETLGEIFNTTTATGQMHYAFGQVPQNSDEERRLERRFLNTGVHVKIHDKVDDVDVINIDGECDGGKGKRKSTIDAPSSYDRMPKKWEKMESYLDVCSEVMAEKLKRQKDKSTEATRNLKEMYSIEECKEVVEEMGDIEHTTFIKMMDKIVTLEWRKIFLKMSDARRRAWLASL